MFKADPKRHPSCSHLMLLPRAASLGPLGRIFYSQWGPGPPGPLLFSVFCFSKRPPARHPEAARPPTHREIKTGRRPVDSRLESWGLHDSKDERELVGNPLKLRRVSFSFAHYRKKDRTGTSVKSSERTEWVIAHGHALVLERE